MLAVYGGAKIGVTLGDLEVYGARCGYVVEGSGYIAELIVSRQLGSAIDGGR